MTFHKYILNADGVPVIEDDVFRWAEWFEKDENRIVAKTEISPEVSVSTIFLGLDHNYFSVGEPVLWETMIFGGILHHEMWRYSSREAAVEGHDFAVFLAKEELAHANQC